VDKNKAAEILIEASRGVITHNDSFHEACRMGAEALSREQMSSLCKENEAKHSIS